MTILYIHGFASCGRGAKGRTLVERFGAAKVLTPDLPLAPRRAVTLLEDLAGGDCRGRLLVGSSLGGYYATWVADKLGLPAVLVNPAVRPYETLARWVGPVRHWCTGEDVRWEQGHLRQLRDYECVRLSHPERFLVLLQTGDEVLDYRDAARKYRHGELVIEAGGSHAFEGFSRQLDRIRDFHGRHLGPL